MPESQPLVADLIVECLEWEGVTHVFGIPGEENIHLVDALSRSSIRFILVRHEQGASFMAETYGRLTGQAGVCLATLGPGAINLLLGVAARPNSREIAGRARDAAAAFLRLHPPPDDAATQAAPKRVGRIREA